MYFKKYVITALLLIASLQPLCQSTPATPKAWDIIFDEAKKSVVQIFTYSGSYDIFRPYKIA